MDQNLKLVAMDADDLKVISSCCQDAILKVDDLAYDTAQDRFVLSMNRFSWEKQAIGDKQKERRRSVLHFERVNSVKVSGISRQDKEMVLSLLAIVFEEGEAPGGTIELVFAGDGAIRLNVECIEAQLSDMPARWSAKSVPSHD